MLRSTTIEAYLRLCNKGTISSCIKVMGILQPLVTHYVPALNEIFSITMASVTQYESSKGTRTIKHHVSI